MATIGDLRQALAKDGVRLIAGAQGISRGIDYITVQEFSFKSSRIQKNGFIMTTFYGFKNLDEIVQHFKWYVKKEISGIGFHTLKIREIPQQLIDIANETGLPLFYIPEDLPYQFIYEKYNDLVFLETTKLKDDIDRLNQEMLDSLVLEKDIHFIIQSVGKYLRVPIIYLNQEKEMVSLWNPIPVSRSDLRKLLIEFLAHYDDLLETAELTKKIIHTDDLQKVNKLNSVLIVPLSNPLSFYGFLMVLNQTEKVPFQESILKNAATALILDGIKRNQTLEFQKNKDIRQFEEIFLNKSHLPLKAENFYYDILQLHSIIIAEPENSNDLKRCYQTLEKRLNKLNRNVLVWIMDKKVIALLQTDFKYILPDDFLMNVGISNEIITITNESIQLAYEQAKIALHFASIHKKKYCKWGDLGIEQITYYLRESALLKDFHLQYIEELIKYDSEHQTDLVKTLYVYLNTFFSLKESGDQLHLHPNTVKYRIKKIQEILPVSFQDATHYINLMISLKSYFYASTCESLDT